MKDIDAHQWNEISALFKRKLEMFEITDYMEQNNIVAPKTDLASCICGCTCICGDCSLSVAATDSPYTSGYSSASSA